MKLLLLVLLLVLGCFKSIAQVNFIWKEVAPLQQTALVIKQIGNNYFLSRQTRTEATGPYLTNKISKFTQNGILVSTIIFDSGDSSTNTIDNFLLLNECEFLAFGNHKLKDDSLGHLCVIKLDTSLNILWEKLYPINGIAGEKYSVAFYPDSNILIGTTLLNNTQGSYTKKPFLIQISKYGDSIRSAYLEGGSIYSSFLSDVIWIKDRFKLFVEGFTIYYPYAGLATIDMDTNLNIIGTKHTPFLFQREKSAIALNDSVYCFAGMYLSDQNEFQVGITKLSIDEDSLYFNHAGRPGYLPDYTAYRKCIAVASPNSIYAGGFANGLYSCTNINQKIMLSNYDSLLNCRWTRFYGGDACYSLGYIEATSDGGCIMAGNYMDPANIQNDRDIVIMKVDSTGIITSKSDFPTFSSHNLTVYPNPGSDFIGIQSGPQITGAEFQLFDPTGCLILETHLYNTYEQFDMSDNAAGTYFWRLLFKGKLVEQGKWIKINN